MKIFLHCIRLRVTMFIILTLLQDPVPPFFTKTNMNKTKTRIINVAADDYNTVILQCFADGIPKPTVTWYKDNMLLKNNNQYFFKHDNQELHIRYLMLYDSGRYSCRAYNSIGTKETYQQIIVEKTKWLTREIILIISISIMGFTFVILVISFTIKIYLEKKIRRYLMEEDLTHFKEDALKCLNLNLTINDKTELLPYDKKWEFPRDRLILREQLARGHFGMVMKAEAIGICENENITTVAVKMVRRTSNPNYIRSLASELKIMVHLGKHLNIVNLLGACTKNISKCELMVIVEYCRFGNLRNYLLRHRNNFINQINPKTGKHDFTIGMNVLRRTINVNNDNSLNTNSDVDMITYYNPGTKSNSPRANSDCVLSGSLPRSEWGSNYCSDNKNHHLKPICTKDLLSWAFQVARGMEYLSQRKILHGDLAARNILLAEDNVVKICDFGLAKTMYKESTYKKRTNDPMPIKWMAIESIRDQIFSTQSDVWSFGIMLWEFFTLAKTPYLGMGVEQQYRLLIEDYRMEQPDYAVDEMYSVMLKCWIAKPTLRPSFTDLVEMVGNLLEKNKIRRYLMEEDLTHFKKDVLECLNPNLTINDKTELLPYDKKWEFPRDRLILREQLGRGHFGMVMKAEAIGICENENLTTVAVKMVHRTSNPNYIRSLANELKIMVHLGKHLNIVNFLGACTKNISKCELMVIVEYCHFGNLRNYFLRHRNNFINQINPKTGKHDFTIGMDVLRRTINVNNDNSLNTNSDVDMITYYNPGTNSNSPKTNSDCVLSGDLSRSEWRSNYCSDNKSLNLKPICTRDLLSWAFQVARGMEYLSQRKILHGDLAAKNILLAEDNVVKICNFGLAKTMYKDGIYKNRSIDPMPIKWMAIESIRDQIFSTQSDVWSFGIMLWEFFTLAKTPYPGMGVEKQYQMLMKGYRMEQPHYAVDEMYNVMLQCWIAKPTLRPSFTDLMEMVGNLLEENYYIILNDSYMDINTVNLENRKKGYLMMVSTRITRFFIKIMFYIFRIITFKL